MPSLKNERATHTRSFAGLVGSVFLSITLVASVLALTPETHAFVSVRSSASGAAVRWNEGSTLVFRTNTNNSSGLNQQSIFDMFTTSLARWKQAAHNGFSFVYYQGTDPARYPNYRAAPQDSTIFFTSGASRSDQLPCGVIALTEVWFDPGSGIATKADLRFNDACFRFTTTPSDTRSQSRIYLADVAQHELGHALGLDHSQSVQSTMIYTAAIEMAVPSCDDQSAMLSLYGGRTRSRTGALVGAVMSPSGGAVFGAHVNVLSLERGIAVASALSDKNGTFRVPGLEPGRYGIVVEPYYPGSSSLGRYYSGINSNVCNNTRFDRTFAIEDGKLKAVDVEAGRDASIGTISVSCAPPGSIHEMSENLIATAPTLTDDGLSDGAVATMSAFTAGSQTHYYKLSSVSGRLRASALSYSLFSNADVYVEFLNASGVRLGSQANAGNVYSSFSGYVNYDSAATVEIFQPQDVYVAVNRLASSIPPSAFPSGSTGVSSTPYYALAVSNVAPSGAIYPVNARCAAPDSFSPYSSPGEAPGLPSDPYKNESNGGACGTLEGVDHDPTSGGGLVRFVNFAGLVILLLVARRQIAARSATTADPRWQ